MTDQITLEEAIELVTFRQISSGAWVVQDVNGKIYGDVYGSIDGDVWLNLKGMINGRSWAYWPYIESPKEKLQRLIEKCATKEELLDAINQLEDHVDITIDTADDLQS